MSELQWSVENEPSAGYSRAVAGITHSQWIEMVGGYEGHFGLGLLQLAIAQAEHNCPTAQWVGPTDPPVDPQWRAVCNSVRQRQSALARDIFGNPFHPIAVDPACLTTAVVELARGIYTDGTYDRIPALADALQDAGWTDEQLLGHCRSPGPHVRGCWAVDLVLGKG